MCGVFCVVLLKLALLSTFWPTSEDIKSHIIIITFSVFGSYFGTIAINFVSLFQLLLLLLLIFIFAVDFCRFFYYLFYFIFFIWGGGRGRGEVVVCLSFLFLLEKGWTKNVLSRPAPLIKTVLTWCHCRRITGFILFTCFPPCFSWMLNMTLYFALPHKSPAEENLKTFLTPTWHTHVSTIVMYYLAKVSCMFAFILHNMYSDIIYVVLFMKQSVAVLNRPYVLMRYFDTGKS